MPDPDNAESQNEKRSTPEASTFLSGSLEDLAGKSQPGIKLQSACPTYSAFDRRIQDQTVVTNETIISLYKAFSGARLSKYMALANKDQRLAVRLHSWNAAVAASLLPSLHMAEVVIRNFALQRLTAKYSKQGTRWYDSPMLRYRLKNSPLLAQLDGIIADEGKAGRRGDLSNYIASELNFGFWVNIFTKTFRPDLWTEKLQTIVATFPKDKTVDDLHVGVEFVRTFRNNVAHHKNLVTKPIVANYEPTLEVLGWLNPVAADFVRGTSPFLKVWDCCPIDKKALT